MLPDRVSRDRQVDRGRTVAIGRWCSGPLLAVLLCVGSVSACSLDGTPSISADGVLARSMTAKPSRADLAHWAPFRFPGAFAGGRALTFGEDVIELKRTLLPQAFGHPWRWHMGDGTMLNGLIVRHRYRHPGAYRLRVFAYYATAHAWYEFDQALIEIR